MTAKNNRRNSGDVISQMVYGKVPPNNTNTEKVILGACLIELSAFERAAAIINSEDFYHNQHILIFSVYERMYKMGKPIDLETVVHYLLKEELLDQAGGAHYVAGLMNDVVSTANLEAHCEIVKEYSLRRQLIRLSGMMMQMSYSDSVSSSEIITELLKSSDLLINRTIKQVSFQDIVFRTVKNIIDRKEISEMGVLTYFPSLDRIIDFFVKGLFYVIAARPAMGKTAFMIQLVKNICRQIDGNVGVIELETYDEVFVQRMIANEIGQDSRLLKRPIQNEELKQKIVESGDKLMDYKIISDFTPTLTDADIRVKAKIWKSKYDIRILFIDYLQYISPSNENAPRQQQVSNTSKTLAILAKELDIPVVAFAQLSREVYKRADKRPQLSDLRESGSIEQDARCVMFLHRPDYYGEIIDAETGRSLEGVTEVIVAKNNDGDTGKSYLVFDKKTNTFIDSDELNKEDKIHTIVKPTDGQGGWRPVEGAEDFNEIPDFN